MIEFGAVPTFEELLDGWDGETAVVHADRELGGWIFICLHSTRLGPAGGGTRLNVYDVPAEGLADAMRLSGAMTRKFAVAGLPFGGGKAVIAVPELPSGSPRRELFLRYGELVDSLGGTFRTSLDMNTGVPDLDVIGERTEYVFGKSVEAGGSGSPSPPTAMGVFHGIRASLGHAFGSDDPAGRTVAIQGAGGVGDPLAGYLADAGATVLVGDIDPARAGEVAERVGGTTLGADEVLAAECDVFAPCAVGGVLNAETIPPGSGAGSSRAPPTTSLPIRGRPTFCTSAGSSTRPTTSSTPVEPQRSSASSSSAGVGQSSTRRSRESAGRCRRSSRRPRHRGSRPGQPPRRSPTSG